MSGKTLLITGASSDIGSALIERIANNYEKIVCHYRTSTAVIDELRSRFGDKIVPLQADFSDRESTLSFVQTVLQRGLVPSHFVHLPSMPNENAKFHKTKWDDFEKHIQVQVHSSYAVCHAIIPVMAKNRSGKIVFMLTENVAKGMPYKYAVPYTTAKYALLGLMKCLASEYADKGITVNGVSPAMIETAFVSQLPEVVRQLNAERSPFKRNLAIGDVIPAFEFLLSSGADTVTGQNILIGVE